MFHNIHDLYNNGINTSLCVDESLDIKLSHLQTVLFLKTHWKNKSIPLDVNLFRWNLPTALYAFLVEYTFLRG